MAVDLLEANLRQEEEMAQIAEQRAKTLLQKAMQAEMPEAEGLVDKIKRVKDRLGDRWGYSGKQKRTWAAPRRVFLVREKLPIPPFGFSWRHLPLSNETANTIGVRAVEPKCRLLESQVYVLSLARGRVGVSE